MGSFERIRQPGVYVPFGITLSALVFGTCWLLPLTVQLAVIIGLLITLLVLACLTLHLVLSRDAGNGAMSTLIALASDPEILERHTLIVESLQSISARKDTIYRKLVLQQLSILADQSRRLANGSIDYPSTEAWRVVYEELLRSPGLYLYRSVSHIESAHYWQDGPGQQSTLLNLELHDAGIVNIERTAIVADHLWKQDELFPIEPINEWLKQQYMHGIWVKLVRESQLAGESELVSDFGIYGSRAVGMQLADAAGRTIRFELSFDFERVKQAESIWQRLQVFATSYRDLLDRTA
jgi:hypothetical protein